MTGSKQIKKLKPPKTDLNLSKKIMTTVGKLLFSFSAAEVSTLSCMDFVKSSKDISYRQSSEISSGNVENNWWENFLTNAYFHTEVSSVFDPVKMYVVTVL